MVLIMIKLKRTEKNLKGENTHLLACPYIYTLTCTSFCCFVQRVYATVCFIITLINLYPFCCYQHHFTKAGVKYTIGSIYRHPQGFFCIG